MVLTLATAAAAAGAAPRGDHALLALNVLPPGQGANAPELTSQIALYDGLTPLRGKVTAGDLTRFYKAERLGLAGERPTSTARPKRGVTIYRDRFGVPHVNGTTRANTEFGAGWATAEDRGLYLQLLRGAVEQGAAGIRTQIGPIGKGRGGGLGGALG